MNENQKKIKSFFTNSKNHIKSLYYKSSSFVTYLFSQTVFYIINDKNDKKKMIISSFDRENLVLFIKICNSKKLMELLKDKCYVVEEGINKKYLVESYDFTKTYDYLLKSNDKYKVIKCYKIKLSDEIIDV